MPRKSSQKLNDLLYPRILSLPRPVNARYHLHPSEMTPDERFDLIADIFAEAYLRIRMEDMKRKSLTPDPH